MLDIQNLYTNEYAKENDNEYGKCTTCKNYSRCNICSDCNDGSNYEFDLNFYQKEHNKKITEWINKQYDIAITNILNNDFKEKFIEEIETLNNNVPNGIITDADTILADLIKECDFEISGIAQDIFNIWKESSDKESVEKIFYEFTDMEFNKYLMKCLKEITRAQ